MYNKSNPTVVESEKFNNILNQNIEFCKKNKHYFDLQNSDEFFELLQSSMLKNIENYVIQANLSFESLTYSDFRHFVKFDTNTFLVTKLTTLFVPSEYHKINELTKSDVHAELLCSHEVIQIQRTPKLPFIRFQTSQISEKSIKFLNEDASTKPFNKNQKICLVSLHKCFIYSQALYQIVQKLEILIRLSVKNLSFVYTLEQDEQIVPIKQKQIYGILKQYLEGVQKTKKIIFPISSGFRNKLPSKIRELEPPLKFVQLIKTSKDIRLDERISLKHFLY